MDPPRLVGATVVPHAPMADAAARKRKIQEDRLKKVEGTVEDHSTRLDTVELRLEEQQQYRFLRVEKSKSLDKLWKEVEDGTVGRNTIRGTAARVLAEEVRTTLRSMSDAGEETLQTKAAELSGGKRALATAEAREATAAGFVLEDLVEWVSRDGNGRYGIRLTPGEPSRLVGESIARANSGRAPLNPLNPINPLNPTNPISGAAPQSKDPPSEFKICKGCDLEISGAPSTQGPTLGVQDL